MTVIGLILAGGASRRFGSDKALAVLRGQRLIDHAIAALRPQVDQLLISGPSSYGTGLDHLVDRADGPCGPVAAHWSVFHSMPAAVGVLTVPVDMPDLPSDLADRIVRPDLSAVAMQGARLHPTIGWWRREDLARAFAILPDDPSLHWLAEATETAHVAFDDVPAFININTPHDMARLLP